MARLFGEKLRALRYRQNLTQTELAHQLGLSSHAHVANLERGKDVPSLTLTLRVAELFNVALDYLLRDSVAVDAVMPSIVELPKDALTATDFGSKLRKLRRQQGLSQIDLAYQLGLARQGYISNLETGKKAPSLKLVVQVADLFTVTIDSLLRDDMSIDVAA